MLRAEHPSLGLEAQSSWVPWVTPVQGGSPGVPQKLSSAHLALGQSSGPEDNSGFLVLLPPPLHDFSGILQKPKVVGASDEPIVQMGSLESELERE